MEIPLQAYFRINAENMGQFERTLIICRAGQQCTTSKGCTAPIYSTRLAAQAVVEIIVKRGARAATPRSKTGRKNVYNLVTKRAVAHEDATMEWIDGNLGTKLTMKYPAVYMLGRGARADISPLRLPGRASIRMPAPRSSMPRPIPRPRSSPSPSAWAAATRATAGSADVARARRARPRWSAMRLCFDDGSESDTFPYIESWKTTSLWSTRPRSARSAKSSSFICKAAALEEEATMYREGLYRAVCQGAADGIRGRDEPPDRAGDGGLRWLMPVGRREAGAPRGKSARVSETVAERAPRA